MSRAKTGCLPDTGSVMAQVLRPTWSVVRWTFMEVKSPFTLFWLTGKNDEGLEAAKQAKKQDGNSLSRR
jgi:hypothetical protein